MKNFKKSEKVTKSAPKADVRIVKRDLTEAELDHIAGGDNRYQAVN